MKNILYILVLMLCISCKKDKSPYSSELENSAQNWEQYKASVNNSYTYISYFQSSFGFISNYSQTKITVQNGVVTGRVYEFRMLPNAPLIGTWTEDKATLNTHTGGAPALTLDDIYTKAKNEWLTVDKTKNNIYFEQDANGIITVCGYSAKDCIVGDCFVGAYIKDITKL